MSRAIPLFGAASYGLQFLSVFVTYSILEVYSSSPVLHQLSPVIDWLELAAVGAVALAWIFLAYFARDNVFAVAGVGTLASLVVYRILDGVFSGSALLIVGTAVYLLIGVAVIISFITAGRSYGSRFLVYTGVTATVFLIETAIYNAITFGTSQVGGGLPETGSILSLTLGLYHNFYVSSIFNFLQFLVPMLAVAGFIELANSRSLKGIERAS